MTETGAKEIVTLLRAATGGRVDDTTIDYFTAALQALDYDVALSTATTGSVVWRFFPSWAEFREIYKTQERLLAPPPEILEPPPFEKRGVAAPEWVRIWGWCRQMRNPRLLIPFPQQGLPEGEPQLSMEEYEQLRQEWISAGRPKPKSLLGLTKGQEEEE